MYHHLWPGNVPPAGTPIDLAVVLEGMTSISALLAAKKAGMNDRNIFAVLFDRDKVEKKEKEFVFLRAACRELRIELRVVDPADIARYASGTTHGGILAICGHRRCPAATVDNLPKKGFLCLLDGIEDPYNFGYAIRSLYAAGCEGILVAERNWLTASGVVARASAGTSEALPIYAGPVTTALRTVKIMGYRVVAAGIRNAVSMYEADLKKPLLLVIGGEKRGISSSVSSMCDQTVRIGYGRAFRGSLSTADATAVLAFEILHQNS